MYISFLQFLQFRANREILLAADTDEEDEERRRMLNVLQTIFGGKLNRKT